jgi:hypothetical protein
MLGKDSFFFGPPCQWGRGPDELSRVSEMFRPVAARLLAVPPEGRQRVWDDFLAGRLQPSPIIEAVHELETPTAASSLERTVPDPPQPTPNHHGENAAEPERRLRLTCAVNLAPREVEWLWAGRVPLGMITMFAGDPKLGKSYVTLAMAAAVLRGLPLPLSDRPNRAGSTILMSAEDDPVRTILPRLAAAGADLTKVHILFVADPRDPTGRRVLLLDNGGNLAPPAKTLRTHHFLPQSRSRPHQTSRIQRAPNTQSSPSVTRKIKCPTGNSAETGKASHKRVVLTPTTITFSTKPHITSPAITSCFLP